MDDNPKEQKREGFLAAFRKKFSRLEKNRNPEEDKEEADLEALIEENRINGIINYDEMDMIENIIRFSDKEAQDVMIHKKDISSVDGEMTIAAVFDRIMEDGFSRYPVYLGERDNIVGMFHIRDFLRAYADVGERNVSLKETGYNVVQDMESVPKTKKINRLFKEMQMTKKHMVAVKGEYGQIKGIVTMEDILEEIFGNIWDEHDVPDTGIGAVEETVTYDENGNKEINEYVIQGDALLTDVERTLGISFDVDDIDTINGYITAERLGRIPEESDTTFEFNYAGYNFAVEKVGDNVIKEVRVKKF